MIEFLLALLVLTAPQIEVRVDGDGYLRFMQEGRMVYAREARLVLQDGELRHAEGHSLVPAIRAGGSGNLQVSLDGRVQLEGLEVGRLVLAVFPAHAPLEPAGVFFRSSDRPQIENPGDGLGGVIRLKQDRPASQPTPAPVTQPQSPQVAPPLSTPTPMPVQAPAQALPTPSTVNPAPEWPAEIDPDRLYVWLHNEYEGSTTQVTLGDVAELRGPQNLIDAAIHLNLGTIPPVGVDRGFERSRIATRLNGIPSLRNQVTVLGSTEVTVRRESQEVGPELIRQALIEHALRDGMNPDELEILPFPALRRVAPGSISIQVERWTIASDRINTSVAIFVDGQRVNSQTVTVLNQSPAARLRVGTEVDVILRSGPASVQTRGRIQRIEPNGQVRVLVTTTRAELTGRALPDGTIEVILT